MIIHTHERERERERTITKVYLTNGSDERHGRWTRRNGTHEYGHDLLRQLRRTGENMRAITQTLVNGNTALGRHRRTYNEQDENA